MKDEVEINEDQTDNNKKIIFISKYQKKWILIYIYLLEVLIAFKVVTHHLSGFVEYATSTALSPSSWVKPIIDPERYWVVLVIPVLPEKL